MPLFGKKPRSQQTSTSNVRMFLENLLQDSSASHLQGGSREQKIQELNIELGDYIDKRLIETLSDIDVALFEHLLLRQPPPSVEECQEFMQRHIPNYLDVVTLLCLEFREQKLQEL